MDAVYFQSRRDRVLEYIITSYIELGVPIGSVTLCERFGFDLSPATIRNIMRQLEDLGYIRQPYTSAGRVPTDAGYRYYVNRLMQPEKLSQEEDEEIHSACLSAKGRPQELIEAALKFLSAFTGQTSLVVFPISKKGLFKEFKLVPLGAKRAVAIILDGSGLIRSIDFECAQDADSAYLQKIADFLNHNCAGKTMVGVRDFLSQAALFSADNFYYLCKGALEILQKIGFFTGDEEKLFLEGTHHIFQQPEFRDTARSQRLLEVLEEKKELLNFLENSLLGWNKGLGDEVSSLVKICIGKENGCEDIQDCSTAISTYGPSGDALGVIGVIGPTRMPYRRVVPVLARTARTVTDLF